MLCGDQEQSVRRQMLQIQPPEAFQEKMGRESSRRGCCFRSQIALKRGTAVDLLGVCPRGLWCRPHVRTASISWFFRVLRRTPAFHSGCEGLDGEFFSTESG